MESYHSLLSDKHQQELRDGSGIAREVGERRGYRTVSASEALAAGFSEDQARDGLLIPFYTPTGEISYQLKPDIPRVIRGKAVKYETRAGYDVVPDVHPRNYWRLLHSGEDLYVVEGIKKADCLTSLGRLVVGLSGVWNWGRKRKRGGAKYGRPELLPDWDAIPLEGRKVYICFDADYREKQNVALAMLRFGERLTERGACVYIINLRGPEKGIDDYVVAGGDVDALESKARPFTASNLIFCAAKRDKRIWDVVASVLDAMRTDDWTERGAATTHSLLRSFSELALLVGRYDKKTETVEFVMDTRTLRQYAAIGSQHTLERHTAKLEERGYVKKIPGDRAKGRANRYILKLSKSAPLIDRGRGEFGNNSIPGAPLDNLAPHLRWPSPANVSAKGDARDSALPESGASPVNFDHERTDVPSIYDGGAAVPEHPELEVSLGKVVEMALHLLVSWGGRGSLRDLATATGVNHTAKMRAKLEGIPGVVGMDDKGQHRAGVWLEDEWERRLDEHRERGGELRRSRQQAVRHRQAREAYRDDRPADEQLWPLMRKEHMERVIEERRREERERHAEEVAREQRKAEQFIAERVAKASKPLRFGLLVETWAEEHRETQPRATWTLRKALGGLGYSLKAHTETPGEMFVYPGGAETVAVAKAAPKRPKPNEVDMVDGVYQHAPECPCEWCKGPGPLHSVRSVEVGSTA